MIATENQQRLPDEHQPLLQEGTPDLEHSLDQKDVNIDFEPGDPANPREWSINFKRLIVALLAFMAFVVTFTCICVVPIAVNIVDELEGHHATSTMSALLVTIWELGEAAGPLIISPLSEAFGRYRIINACNTVFIFATLLAALSTSVELLIAARWLTGFAVATNVLNPSIIGDIFESDQRGSPMSLISLAPLIGGAIGPAMAGAVAQTLGWRQVLFLATGLAVVAEILFLTCFHETYKTAILQRRFNEQQASNLAKPENRAKKLGKENMVKIWEALKRPFAVLFGSSVLILLSIQVSISFSFFYIMSISLPNILQDTYGFNSAETGVAFVILSIGFLLGVLVCSSTLDKIYIRLRGPNPKNGKPEYRLPLTILGAILLPLAVMSYGWIAQLALPAPLLLASVAFLNFTLLINIISAQAYVIDACGLYSASAMTGVIVTRCLMSTFLPLITQPLAYWLGYGWGFSILAAVAAVVAIIPVLLYRYGAAWRERSVYTRAI